MIFEANPAQAERALTLFDTRLASNKWIAADRFTIADGILFTGLEFARMVKFKVGEETPNLLRWQADDARARVGGGRGVGRIFPDEGRGSASCIATLPP